MPSALIYKRIIETKGYSIGRLERELGLSNGSIRKAIERNSDLRTETIERLSALFPDISKQWLYTGEGEMFLAKQSGAEISLNKAINGRQQKGILAVPIKAQAGYARMLHDDFVVFTDQLNRIAIPDFPYDGDEFRMFQVEGDSMEYVNEHGKVAGLHSGIWVVGQRVPHEDWKENLAKYRVHVIVLNRQILIKRILQDNPDEIILHSDNEELHPQERISLKDVQEIWYVVRKLDWDMPPPRRIEIKA